MVVAFQRARNTPRRLWTGDVEVFENLLDLDTECLFVFTGKDPASQRCIRILEHFLENHKPPIPVVEIPVADAEEASWFQIAAVPQLRLYHRGQLLRRHRGVPSVEVLAKFYRRTLK